jgi:Uma2 family endonuclease
MPMPAAERFGDDHLEPDLLVFPPGAEPAARWIDMPPPVLVIEIASRSTRRCDAGIKREAYLRWGIPEYWQLDPERRRLTVSRPGQADVSTDTTYEWRPIPAAPSCLIDLTAVFA